MKIDTFDSRAVRAEGIATGAGIPGLAPDLVKSTSQLAAQQLSQSKSAKKKHKSKQSAANSNHHQSNNSGCNSSKEDSKASASQQKSKSSSSAAAAAAAETCSDPAKKLRNLKKKLRDIEALETKMEEGVKLEPEQLEKVSRKIQVENEIDELESKV